MVSSTPVSQKKRGGQNEALRLPTNEPSVGLSSAHEWLPGVGRYLLQQPAPVGSLSRVGCGASRLLRAPHPPQGRCGSGGAVGEGPTGARLAAPRRGELLPSRATRLDFPKAGVLGGEGGWVAF